MPPTGGPGRATTCRQRHRGDAVTVARVHPALHGIEESKEVATMRARIRAGETLARGRLAVSDGGAREGGGNYVDTSLPGSK